MIHSPVGVNVERSSRRTARERRWAIPSRSARSRGVLRRRSDEEENGKATCVSLVVLEAAEGDGGHAEPAAGTLGLATLCAAAASNLVFGLGGVLRSTNPHVAAAASGASLLAPRQTLPFASNLGGVSAFAFQGTNAHVRVASFASRGFDHTLRGDRGSILARRTSAWAAPPTVPTLARAIVSPDSASFEVSVATTRGAAGSGFMDHRVAGRAIFPAAGMLRVALDATRAATRREVAASERTALTDASVPAPLLCPLDRGSSFASADSASGADTSLWFPCRSSTARTTPRTSTRDLASSPGRVGATATNPSPKEVPRSARLLNVSAPRRASRSIRTRRTARWASTGCSTAPGSDRFARCARHRTAGSSPRDWNRRRRRAKTRRRRVSWTAPRRSPRRSESPARRFAFPRRSGFLRRSAPIRCIRVDPRAATPRRRFAARASPTTRSTPILDTTPRDCSV